MDIRNGEDKVTQGVESSFCYPSNEQYDMFTYD